LKCGTTKIVSRYVPALSLEIDVKTSLSLSALAFSAALCGTPALAQTGATHSTTMAPATGHTGNAANTAPSDRNPVMTKDGQARSSKIVGSSVYNDHDEKVGSIDDLLIGQDGKINAVLSVGGFLGMGTKYIEVPYADLTFGNTQRDSDNRVVMRGATKESLKAKANYDYYKG
jgi:hypothetical protein